MRIDWYKLPGPAAFVGQVADDLRAGKSATVRFTDATPKGFTKAVKALLAQEPLNWHELPRENKDPLSLLFEHFNTNRRCDGVASINGLFEFGGFRSAIVEAQVDKPESWVRWISFLEDFEFFSRSLEPLARSQFLLTVHAAISTALPKPDLLLCNYDLSDSYSPNDLRIYSMCLVENSIRSSLKKQLSASISAELAIWDRNLCEKLCEATLSDLLDPFSLLRDYAHSQHWLAVDTEADFVALKARGIYCEIEQKYELHSAYLAARGEIEPIRHRIWRGMVAVLYPAIELRRQEILKNYRFLFDLPHRSPDGTLVSDYLDLDWGNVCYQFWKKRQIVDRALYQTAHALRDARNALAHNELVSVDLINSGVLERPIEGI